MAGKREKKSKKKKGAGIIIVILLLIFALSYIVASKVFSDYKNYNAVLDPSDTELVAVNIPSGATTSSIASILYESGIIGDEKKFKMKSRLNDLDGTFQAGDYLFSPAMSTEEIMETLQTGKVAVTTFTIPEGYTVKQTAEKLAEDGLIASPEEFYAACEKDWDYWFLDGVTAPEDPTGTVSEKANRLEGYLFPETYQIYIGASAEDIAGRMLSQFDKVFTPLWEEAGGEKTAASRVNGLTSREIATMSSLIERESKVTTDRDKIASVMYNRLDIGMKLQIDATVLYAMGEWKERVYYSDLETPSPYNTYYVSGLPAGPICSSGKASLEAALYPATTNYIYYVLKGDGSGEHNFAENAAQFEQYKQEYLNSL